MKKWPFSFRSVLALIHDIAVAIFAWYSAFLLRFNFNIPLEQIALIKKTIVMIFVVEAITSIFLVYIKVHGVLLALLT